MSTITTDNIGGGGYPFPDNGIGSGGLWIFALIFLFIVFVMIFAFRRDNHHDNNHGYEGLIAGVMPAIMGKTVGNNCGYNSSCGGHGPSLCDVQVQEVKDTGKIIHDIDVQTAQLQHSMDLQNCATQKMIGKVFTNQNKLAWDAERLFNIRTLDDKNEKLAEMRLTLAEKDAKILQQETVNTICRSNGELNSKIDNLYGHLQHELSHIKDKMLKAPTYIPYGGVQAMNLCMPMPT